MVSLFFIAGVANALWEGIAKIQLCIRIYLANLGTCQF